jgi:hypothetical protein
MKKILIMSMLILGMNMLSANAGEKPKKTLAPQIKFETLTQDLGKIEKGKPKEITYEFKNTGNAPLIISRVQPGCGCTTQSFTQNPIKPGKKGIITLTYNAASEGQFSKSATVFTNCGQETITLSFKGEVIN